MVSPINPSNPFASQSMDPAKTGSAGCSTAAPSPPGIPGTPSMQAMQQPGAGVQNLLAKVAQTLIPALEHSGASKKDLAALESALQHMLGGSTGSTANSASAAKPTPSTSTGGTGSTSTGGTGSTSTGGTGSTSTGGTGSTSTGGTGSTSTGGTGSTSTGGTGSTQQADMVNPPKDDPDAIQHGVLQEFKSNTKPTQKSIDALKDPTAQPSIGNRLDGTTASYTKPTGPTSIWGDGKLTGPNGTTAASPSDLAIQGAGAGDCYAMSSWSSYAKQNPEAAKDMVRPDPSGKPDQYQVRFYSKDPDSGKPKEEWVSVDDKMPTVQTDKGAQPGQAITPKDGSGNTILGPALIEKAFAKFNDAHHVTQGANQTPPQEGYAGINGGAGPEALYAFTGKDSSSLLANPGKSYADSGTTNQNLEKVLGGSNNGKPVMASSVGDGQPGNGQPKPDANGIVPSHQYTVLGTHKDDKGNTVVQLRNPWAGNTPEGVAGHGTDGVFTLTLDQYKKSFGATSIGD